MRSEDTRTLPRRTGMEGAHRTALGIGIASIADIAGIGIASIADVHNYIHIETFVLHQLRASRSTQIKAVPNHAATYHSNCVKWQQ
jgi:hypothetical protein